VTHGLRKAAARRLAEAGCTEKQIAAITGHTTLKEIARYTKAADQERLAIDAISKLAGHKPNRNSQPRSSSLGNRQKNKTISS
jgi:integrase